ncbi:MAG: hypothetical protein AAF799_06110 [Myxococcota bacterium]
MDIKDFHQRLIANGDDDPWAVALRRVCDYQHDGELTGGTNAQLNHWDPWGAQEQSAQLSAWTPWGAAKAQSQMHGWQVWNATDTRSELAAWTVWHEATPTETTS